jgi:DNA-binding response OmpR family regulator
MKILLIEDEVKLAEYLRKGLGEVGYVVDVAHNGVDGLHMALEGGHDLLVLDAMLPGIDGFSLLTAFRKTRQTPVLMLTARVSVEDRVLGLQTGADDYLVKPLPSKVDAGFSVNSSAIETEDSWTRMRPKNASKFQMRFLENTY